MEKKLNFCKTLNLKGGDMFKKILSVLVVCFFMISNVCFAMPIVSSTLKSSVDNMALQSFLEKGDKAELGAVTTMFKALLNQELKGNEQMVNDAMAMWAANLKEVKAKDAHTAVAGDLEISIDEVNNELTMKLADGRSLMVKVDENGEIKITGEGYVAKFESDETGEVTKEEAKAGLNKLIDAAMETAVPAPASLVNSIQSEADDILSKAVAEGRISQDLADEINDGLKKREITLVDAQATGTQKYFVAKGTSEKIILPNGMRNYTDLAIHEVLEASGRSHQEILQIQAGIHNIDIKDREKNTNPMGKTREDINKIRSEALEKEQAKTPALKMNAKVNKDKIEQGDAEHAREIAKEVLPAEQHARIDDATDEQVLGIVKTAISEALKTIKTLLAKAMDSFRKKIADSNIVTNEQRAKLQAALNSMKDGRQTALSVDDLTKEVKGETVLTESAMWFLNELDQANVRANAFALFGAGTVKKQAAVAKVLELSFPNLAEKIKVYEGKENTIERDKKAPLTVIYSNSDSINGNVEGAEYFQVENLNSAKANILQALIDVMSLSPEQKKAMAALTEDGVIMLTAVEIDDTAYEAMQEDYKKIVDLLVQA